MFYLFHGKASCRAAILHLANWKMIPATVLPPAESSDE